MKHKIDFVKFFRKWLILSLLSLLVMLVGVEIFKAYSKIVTQSENMRENYLSHKKELIKNEVMQAVSLINYEIEKTNRNNKEFNNEIFDQISRVRFGREGYIFVVKFNGDVLVSNGQKLSGEDKLWEIYNDNPQKIKDVFNQEYQASQKVDGGFIKTTFIKLSDLYKENPVPKLSYIYGIPELKFFIGAGIYIDDIEKDIMLLKENLIAESIRDMVIVIFILLIIVVISLMAFSLIFKKIDNDLNQFNKFFSSAAKDDKHIDLANIKFSNFEKMALNANNMLDDKIEAQQNLLDEREQLFVTIRSVGDGLITINDEGKVELMNMVAEKLTGWNIDEARGMELENIFNIVDENSREQVENPVTRVLSENKVIGLSNHIILISRDGTEYNIADSAAPIKDANNKVRGVVLVFRDITKEYRIQEELRHSEARYSRLSDLTYEGILIHNKGFAIDVNSALERISGYTAEELIGKNIIKFLIPEKYHEMLLVNLEKEVSAPYEIEGIRKNGSIVKLEIESRNIASINKKTNTRVTAIRDVSEKVKMLDDIVVAKEKAENASKMKSIFLAQMSHEIRTPINALVSMASLLRYDFEAEADDDQLMSFEIIDRAGDRIIRTVDLLLNLSEIQSGTYETTQSKFDLYSEILANIVADNKKIVEKNNLKISLTTNSTDTELVADFYTVRQIFIQLIENAVKYTDEGEISIVILRNEIGELVVEVKDTGVGIEEEYLSNLFDPFSQEEMGYTRKYEGNGIGLTLVKKYSELNNATVEVKSKKNVGSTFRVVFS